MTNNPTDGIKMLTITFLLLNGLLSAKSITVNAKGFYNHPGETRPVIVEQAIGTDFNVTCYMNPYSFSGENSSCLHFVNSRTNKQLPRENIVTINSTTIVYMEHNATEQQSEYRCLCGQHAIMETKVFVGSPPKPVKDFSCRSYDFEYMVCNFTKPHNPILTTYNVSFYIGAPNYIYLPDCYYGDRKTVVCNTSHSFTQEIYHYKIESRNALVKANEPPLKQEFEINNFVVMIPSKPGLDMRIDSLTVNSIKLAWKMITWEKYRPIGLQWEILLQPQNFSIIPIRDVPTREFNEMRLRINNLPYAFWHYKLMIRVRVKHPSAIWSEQFVYTFRTEARPPQRPPKVDPGSFYVDTSETDITIYWEELLPEEYNGDNFTYVITSVLPDGRLTDLKPKHQEKNLAKFKFQKDLYYEFHIRSKNHLGESSEASRLIVYPTRQHNRKEFSPQNIHNIYHDNNRSYTLIWSKPNNLTDLMGYTVFWCYRKRILLNECKESIHFKQIPAEKLNFTTDLASEERSLNLAVSANYYNYNTGLHWTGCSMDMAHADFVKMEPEIRVATANKIELQWSVEGVCPSILNGFNITYCEVANNATPENATCLENKSITVMANNTVKKYYIEKLKPFTMYKITMFMYWHNKKSPPSVPQIVRTLEGAPSPPRQLRVESKTNSSAVIKWLEPTEPNGKINKYIIMLNNEQIVVDAKNLTYRLNNLESFTAYKVYVMAETVERSQTSNDVHFTTDIGVPSSPSINLNNVVNNVIQWNKPAKPRGPIDFYEVRVTQMLNDEIIRQHISTIFGATSCNLSTIPTCIGPDYKTTIDVRAVNVVPLDSKQGTRNYLLYSDNDDNNDLECSTSDSNSEKYINKMREYMNDKKYMLLKSDWQTTALYSCSKNYFSKIATIAFSIVGMSLGVLAAFYMARKKYNKMANINCTLPAGLETYFTKETGAGFPGDFGNGSHTIKDTRLAEDQWISAARMHDFNFRNEHHHLLASLGNDSGYLGGGGVGGVGNNSGDAFNDHIITSSLKTDINEDNGTQNEDADDYEKEHLKESFQSNSSSADSLVESTEGSECNNLELEHSPLAIFPSNNGYIKQSMLPPPWQTFNNHDDDQNNESSQLSTIPTTAAANGYITVQNLNHALAKQTNNPNDFTTNTGGYVLQQDLQNFFNNRAPISNNNVTMQVNVNPLPTGGNMPQINNDGYTTVESLNKLNLPISVGLQSENNQQQSTQLPNVSNINQLPPNSTDSNADIDVSSIAKTGGISGYVTQQDLNLFAQHQHNH